jgi:hypothetical protein
MQHDQARRSSAIAIPLALTIVATAATAQGAADDAQSRWRPFASVTPWGHGSTDLDGGGDFRAAGAMFRLGANGPFGAGHRGGLTIRYDHTDYRFGTPTAFGNRAPWDDVIRVGLSAPLVFRAAEAWSYLVTPTLDYSMEDGAKSSDAFGYGAALGVVRRFDPERRIGFGFGVFERIEKTRVLPFIVVDWRLTDRLRLSNAPSAVPPSGPGLELNYRLPGGWVIGGGGAYRSERFRLRDDGAFPNGIGEERGFAAYARASRRFGRDVGLDLYAGALLSGELRVEDAEGNNPLKQDFDPAPFVGATLSVRF